MTKETAFENTEVEAIFLRFPEKYREKLMLLRQLIFDTWCKNDIWHIEETLKWGEPSYLAKHWSTIRINQNKKWENSYAIYFKCTSLLVPTFKKLYPNDFTYQWNRAIVFQIDEKINIPKLVHCIQLALTYHLIKNNLKNYE